MVKQYKTALVKDGAPATSFAADDVHAEFGRLRRLGAHFTEEPLETGPVATAVLDDGCGNLIQIAHSEWRRSACMPRRAQRVAVTGCARRPGNRFERVRRALYSRAARD